MMVLKNRSDVPHGGQCRYVDPDTGKVIQHPYIGQVEIQAKAHRLANNLPVGLGFNRKVEDNICRNTPGIACIEAVEYVPPKPLSLLERIAKFLTSMNEWRKQGFEVVHQSIYEERQATCEACPHWRGESMFGYGSCGVCRCSRLKLFLVSEDCPKDKWKR